MAIHISTRCPPILIAPCRAARARAGLVAWTVLAAGAVAAGAMLGLPVQSVARTAHTCDAPATTTVRIESRDSDLFCVSSGADRPVGGL
jgi:hypothetical protein